MIKKCVTAAGLFCAGAVLLAGQGISLSIAQAEEKALANNPEIERVETQLRQAKIGTRQSISAFLPSVDLTGQRILDEKVIRVEFPSLIPGEPPSEFELDFTKNYEMTLQVVQPLFTGGKIYFNLRRSLELREIQQYLLESKRNEIQARTRSTYYSVLMFAKSVEIAEDGLKLAQDIRDKIKVMFEEGMVTRLDLLRAENRITEVTMRVKEARSRLVSRLVEAQNNLKTLLDFPLDQEINLTSEISDRTYILDRDTLLGKMTASNPLLNSLENQVRISQYSLRQAYGNLLPSLSLAAQYNVRGDELDQFAEWDDYYTISLNLSLPVFRGLSQHFTVARARAQKQDTQLQEKISQRNFATLLTNCLKRDETLLEKIDFARENLENNQKEFEIARFSYDEGLISYTDLEQIHNSLLAAQLTVIQAVFEYHTNIFQIETLISEEIASFKGE
jgi:outer membrane protein TolC